MGVRAISNGYLTQHLWMALSLILISVFILNKTQILRQVMLRYNTSLSGKLFLAGIFGAVGVLGTYFGIEVKEGSANIRAVGVIVGGLVGGPIVGTGAGIIAGLYRFLVGGGISADVSGISAVVQGALAGYLHTWIRSKKEQWKYALLAGVLLEVLHMVFLLVLVEDTPRAIHLVTSIAPAMLITNPIGIATFVGLLEDAFRAQEKTEAFAARIALRIANKTMSFLRTGLNEQSAGETASIIYREVDNLAAVGITSRERMLALVGMERKASQDSEISKINAQVLASGETGVFQRRAELGSASDGGPLLSQVIVPLKDDNQVIGSLVLYKKEENSISLFETELAQGLANLISTQIQISKGERQAKLLVSAEVKALQAQINPHFLFNALNTISYYCRKQPETAKRLIGHLGNYYRNHLAAPDSFVTLNKELQYVDDYIKIEMARFGDRLIVLYQIEPDCNIVVPPLILQPLVENAVKHGINPKEAGGSIRITGEYLDNAMKLTVEDDGVGMEPEFVENLLKQDAQRTSIGLSNVHQRLVAIYGPDFGLTVKSKKDIGTTVSLIIPQREEVKYDTTKSSHCG